jgi:hypothetical protein
MVQLLSSLFQISDLSFLLIDYLFVVESEFIYMSVDDTAYFGVEHTDVLIKLISRLFYF